MKFRNAVIAMAISATVWTATGADSSVGAAASSPTKGVDDLIRDLDDDQYKVREEASRQLWEIGDPALPALQRAANGKDPEQAFRARELVRKIALRVTPDTDPAVMELLERYSHATPGEKPALFEQMRRRRAWRQMLKLYALETAPDDQLQQAIQGVAVIAARGRLLAGDAAGAREYLEMAPANASGLLALAEFHRSQGTLEAELERSKTLPPEKAHGWQLALYRASGNLESARDAAIAAGEPELAAEMATLAGDPLPWLRLPMSESQSAQIQKNYTELAIRRWQGQPVGPSDLEYLIKTAASNQRDPSDAAIDALFLLGELGPAESAYLKKEPLEAFSYFDSLERVPEALKALGLDPDKPDYKGWVGGRINRTGQQDAEEDHDSSTDNLQQLMALANFLERRGLYSECESAFMGPLLELAKKDDSQFQNFLGSLFGGPQQRSNGAQRTAVRIASAWAGEDNDRWSDVVIAAVGEESELNGLWDWLAELDPKATRLDRLNGLLALCGMGKDPGNLRASWMKRIWTAVEQTPADKRQPLISKIILLTRMSPDLVMGVKVWEMIPKDERSEILSSPTMDMGAAGRWQEAADFYLYQVTRMEKNGLDANPGLHALAAACLRKVGKTKEAEVQDGWVDKLALGADSQAIAVGYSYGEDTERAAEWYARAARQADPAAHEFAGAIENLGEIHLEKGRWKEAGAIYEVLAQIASTNEISAQSVARLRLRLQSDLGRALANLQTDRAGSMELLAKCHSLFPSDGSLADFFFPALRKAGLIKEHDEWFKKSWDQMTAVLARYPESDNTCNTAAWLASRARRNLNEAENLAKKALTLSPEQSAYLDTMAEIQFAKGNRAAAVEWSAKAVNFDPNESVLRRQLHRFRTAPLGQ